MPLPFDRAIVSPVLVGRAEPLASLDRLIGEVRSGHGTTVTISGEAGIGKSRLVKELEQRVAALDWRVLRGNCFEPDTSLPYAPLLDLLRTFAVPLSAGELARNLGPSASLLVKLMPEWACPGRKPRPWKDPTATILHESF